MAYSKPAIKPYCVNRVCIKLSALCTTWILKPQEGVKQVVGGVLTCMVFSQDIWVLEFCARAV